MTVLLGVSHSSPSPRDEIRRFLCGKLRVHKFRKQTRRMKLTKLFDFSIFIIPVEGNLKYVVGC
jgi:hypothetical protein